MKIIATKYNYQIVQALEAVEFIDRHEDEDDFLSIKNIIGHTPEGKHSIVFDEMFTDFSELEQERILNEFLTDNPNNIFAKHELIFLHQDSKHFIDLFLKHFSKEKDHIENGDTYDEILSFEEVRMIVMHLSMYYKTIEDKDRHRSLLKWTIERGLYYLSEIVVADIHTLESPFPTAESMSHFDDVRIWTHNLLISDIFNDLNKLPYNLEFIGLINWGGNYLDHDIYLRILDSEDEHIHHDVRWLFYQNLVAYQKANETYEVSGILALINFINHFELADLVELATASILSMSEDLFHSMVFDIERIFLDGPLMELIRLNSNKAIETIMNDEILDEMDPEFRWFILSPFFRVVASLSAQDNEEGKKYQLYFRQLNTYFLKYDNVSQWLLGEGETYNYSVFKDIIDPAYKNGIMNPTIYGPVPIDKNEEQLPMTYDKKSYFTIIDKDWKTFYTKTFNEENLDKLEARIKSEIEKKLKESASYNSNGILDFLDDFEDDDDDKESEDDLSWLLDHSDNINKDVNMAKREANIIPITFKREDPKVGRNEPCPCGSGKKYKKCCLNK